ncbi:MAG: hypothetical protein M1835_007847 [Candelina submexicana]|nr:MAG: hypothetical protein M1835_007847 [Candelina submexicana]
MPLLTSLHLILRLLNHFLLILPSICSPSSLSIPHPEKSLVKRPVVSIPLDQQPYCHVKYGSPDGTECRFAISRLPVDHANSERIRNWQMRHLISATDSGSVRMPVVSRVKQCIVRIDLGDYFDTDFATWRDVKARVQLIQDNCVNGRSMGGMASTGSGNKIWVSIYNKGSYIDALQQRAHKHGVIAGTLAAHGDHSVLNECKAIGTSRGEAPGLGPGSLYDYEDPNAWQLPSQPTAKDGYNAYCLKGEDCACGYCQPVEVQGKNLLLGLLETVGTAIGGCQNEVDFGSDIGF